MLVGAFVPTALLILLSAAFGFLAAWFWRARQFDALARENKRLRRHRQRYERDRAREAARIDAALANQRIAEEELALLNQSQAALEEDHARLVSRHANLMRIVKKRLPDRVGDREEGAQRTADEDAPDGSNEGASAGRGTPADPASVIRGEGPGSETVEVDRDEHTTTEDSIPGSRKGAGTADASPATDDGSTLFDPATHAATPTQDASEPAEAGDRASSVESVAEDTLARASGARAEGDEELGTTAAWFGDGEVSLDEPGGSPDIAGRNELEVFSAQLATASDDLASVPVRGRPTVGHAGDDLDVPGATAPMEPADREPDRAGPSDPTGGHADEEDAPLEAAAAELEALRAVLDAREQEIRSLREQLAPLLGLPLTVSTREAERDRLARRLAERESEIASLQARLSAGARGGTVERSEPAPRPGAGDPGTVLPGETDTPSPRAQSRPARAFRAERGEPEASPIPDEPPPLHAEVPLDTLVDELRALDEAAGVPATPGSGRRTDPVGPAGATESGETTNPAEETGASESTGPAESGNPADSTDPAGTPGQTGRAGPAGTAEPTPPAEPAERIEDQLSAEAWPDSKTVRQWEAMQASVTPEPGSGWPESEAEAGPTEEGSEPQGRPRAQEPTGAETAGPASRPALPPVPRQYSLAPDRVDDLKRIVGIGPVIERMLNRMGVYQLEQIAAWNADDVAFFDAQLDEFSGRIERDRWVDQARDLSTGE